MDFSENGNIADRNRVKVDSIYNQLCQNLRATDDISFKLLGLVPLVTGAAYLGLFVKSELGSSVGIYYISILGALITLSFFCWELRNIKTCNYLSGKIEKIESDSIETFECHPGNEKPALFNSRFLEISKTRAVKSVYTVTTLAWLFLPEVFGPMPLLGARLCLGRSADLIIWAVISVIAMFLLIGALLATVDPDIKTAGDIWNHS